MPILGPTAIEAQKQIFKDNRAKLRKAFAELNKDGWFARMNYGSCNSDFLYNTPDDKPCIAFHSQDEKKIMEYGYVYLWHHCETNIEPHDSNDHKWGNEIYHKDNIARAWEAVAMLRKHELDVDWSGDPRHRIRVTLNKNIDEFGWDKSRWMNV
jgi:hypothetical protein